MDVKLLKKIGLSSAVVVIFLVYAIHDRVDGAKEVNIPVPTVVPISSGKYKDGTYTGPVTDAFYGDLQIQIAVQDGKISDVTFLKYPNDRKTSIEINEQAMPVLKEEAIQAQSANVDIVSGATQTSQAFIESLKAVLKLAS